MAIHMLSDDDITPFVPTLNEWVDVETEGGKTFSGNYLGHHRGGVMFVNSIGAKPWGIDVTKIVAVRAGGAWESDE